MIAKTHSPTEALPIRYLTAPRTRAQEFDRSTFALAWVTNCTHAEDAEQYFRVTHPFHPWRGRRFEFVDCRRCWGQWRVFYYTEDGQSAFFPASWTDAGQADPFVVLSRGRAFARFGDLLRLVDLIEDLKASVVNEIRPDV